MGIITANPNRKFMKLAKVKDMGMNSLGIVNCLIKWALLTMEEVVSDRDVEKKIHGRIAESTKKV